MIRSHLFWGAFFTQFMDILKWNFTAIGPSTGFKGVSRDGKKWLFHAWIDLRGKPNYCIVVKYRIKIGIKEYSHFFLIEKFADKSQRKKCFFALFMQFAIWGVQVSLESKVTPRTFISFFEWMVEPNSLMLTLGGHFYEINRPRSYSRSPLSPNLLTTL